MEVKEVKECVDERQKKQGTVEKIYPRPDTSYGVNYSACPGGSVPALASSPWFNCPQQREFSPKREKTLIFDAALTNRVVDLADRDRKNCHGLCFSRHPFKTKMRQCCVQHETIRPRRSGNCFLCWSKCTWRRNATFYGRSRNRL